MSRTIALPTYLSLCVLVVSTMAHAEVAVRVADVLPGPGDGVPELEAAVYQGKLYFRATNDGSQFDLWVYDGVNPAMIVPGSQGLDPRSFEVWNGELYFRGVSGGDAELWRYDGASAPELAKDLSSGLSSDPNHLKAFGNKICFGAVTPSGREFGCWSGVGSAQFYETGVGNVDGNPDDLVLFDGKLAFSAATTAGSVRRLFTYDGFSAPVEVPAAPTDLTSPRGLTPIGTQLYMIAGAPDGGHVWRWNGSGSPAAIPPALGFPGALVAFRGQPYVYVGQGQYGVWRVEPGGLVRVSQQSLSGGSYPLATSVGGAIYYLDATTTVNEIDLHRFCGSESILLVTDQFAGTSAWVVAGRTIPFAGRLFFAAHDAAGGSELWSVPAGSIFCDGAGDGTTGAWSSTID